MTLPTSAEGIKKNFQKLLDKAQKEKEEKEAKEAEEGLMKEELNEDLWENAPAALKEEAEGFHTGLFFAFLFSLPFFSFFFFFFFFFVHNLFLSEGWLHLPEEELAQQMTKVETDIFVSILPKEYLAWNKKNRDVLAPNISFVFLPLFLSFS